MSSSDRWPQAYVIGAARSGTTALCEYLNQHPGIEVLEPKEPHYFAFADQPVRFRGPGDEATINTVAVSERGDYLALVASRQADALVVDGSVSTLYYADEAIPRLLAAAPEARLVAILREPVERAWSSYSYLRSRGLETLSFADAVDAEEQRIADGWHHMWHYVQASRYRAQLETVLAHVDPSRLLVLRHADLEGEPVATTARVFAHFGVAPHVVTTLGQVNTSGLPRTRIVGSALGALNRSQLRWTVRRMAPASVRSWAKSRVLQRPERPPEAAEVLRDRFADDLSWLRAELGVTFEEST
jgi:hypothetical protein